MCKPKICKTIFRVNQNEPNVNFLPPYANHKILVIPKSFTKSLRVTAYFYGLITCPTFLVQSVEVTFWGEKKVYMVYTGLHRFTSVCPPMCDDRKALLWPVTSPSARRDQVLRFGTYLWPCAGGYLPCFLLSLMR